MSVLGWRWFNVSRDGGLMSFLGEREAPWPPDDVHKAVCVYHHSTSGIYTVTHKVPSYECSCGFYLFKWSEDAWGLPHVANYQPYCKVLAACEAWGTIIEHEWGFRAEFSRVRAIYQLRGKQVHAAYKVDRCTSLNEIASRWEEAEEKWPDG